MYRYLGSKCTCLYMQSLIVMSPGNVLQTLPLYYTAILQVFFTRCLLLSFLVHDSILCRGLVGDIAKSWRSTTTSLFDSIAQHQPRYSHAHSVSSRSSHRHTPRAILLFRPLQWVDYCSHPVRQRASRPSTSSFPAMSALLPFLKSTMATTKQSKASQMVSVQRTAL